MVIVISIVSQSGCYHAKNAFLEVIILPNVFTPKFSEWNSKMSTLKPRKIGQIKAMRKGMFSFVTGKIAVPDRVISSIRGGQREFGFGTDKYLKK